MSALLTRKGFEVDVNASWEEAVNKIESFSPQLIILDVFLAGVDGLEVCKQLKSSKKTKHIPILIFSAYPRIAEKVIYEYGADGFLSKPFEVQDLIEKVHSVLSQNAGMA